MPCARCGAAPDRLVELHRFDDAGAIAIEEVCPGCLTRLEVAIAARIPSDPDLQAFVLSLAYAVDQLHAARAHARPSNLREQEVI